jgi:periplasmic copper chaperone A
MSKLTLALTAVQVLIAGAVLAAPPQPQDVSVVEPWVRLPPPGAKNTGAFMVLKNSGKADRKVVSASNPASKVTELHTHIDEGGVKKMRQVPSIEVKAGGSTELKPGSLHVMLIDLTAPLKEGQQVPITLKFDDGSTTVIQAPVRKFDMPPMGGAAPAAPKEHEH